MFQFLNFKNHLQRTWQRFPLALITSFSGTIIALIALQWEIDEVVFLKMILVCILSTFVLSSFTVWKEEHTKGKDILLVTLVLFLIGFGWFGIPKDPDSAVGSLWIIRYMLMTALSFFSLSFVASLGDKKTSNKSLWNYNRQYLTHLIITFISGALIFLGVMLALFALDKLFGVSIEEKVYMQLWTAIVGIFGTTFFLSHFPRKKEGKKTLQIPFALSFITKFICTPLVLLYFVILYAYTAKILITWDWPNNMVGWLTIIFLMIGVLTSILWIPLHTPKTEKYKKVLWMVLIPQIIVLFMSVGLRIQQYSWTESRYMVVVLGLWLLCIALYFILSKYPKLKVLLASLITLLFLTQFGPWSMYSVGKTSQTSRLKAYDLKNKEALKKVQKDSDARKEITSIVRYLVDRHGVQTLVDIYPDLNISTKSAWEAQDEFFNHFNLNQYEYGEENYKSVYGDRSAIDITGYNVFIPYVSPYQQTINGWKARIKEDILEITSPKGNLYTTDLTSYKNNLWLKKDSFLSNEDLQKHAYEFEVEGLEGKIIPRSLYFEKDTVTLQDMRLLLKEE